MSRLKLHSRRLADRNHGAPPRAQPLLFLLSTLVLGAPALAQGGTASQTDYRGSINSSLGLVGANQDAAGVLFPAVAAMEAPPDSPVTMRAIALMTRSSPDWARWVSWAEAAPQKAVLEALAKVTDPKNKYVMGFNYGREGVDPALIKAGLFVDLGKPPLLAMAALNCQYLEPLENVSRLCTIEAARLADSGNGADAINVLVNWARLGRIVADRQFGLEKIWGLVVLIQACERLRDLAYQHPDAFTEQAIVALQREIDTRALNSDRLRFPEGEKSALMELVRLTFEERGGPKTNEFPVYLGSLYQARSPLEAFNSLDMWSRIAPNHAGYFDTVDQIEKVFGDWQKRWSLTDLFDPLLLEPTDYSKMDPARFAVISALTAPLLVLLDLRTTLAMELIGTRAAMACIGFRARNKQWPPNIAAVQPAFVGRLDDDPWSFDPKSRTRRHLQYFVPIRDSVVGPRELPRPHSVTVWLPNEFDLDVVVTPMPPAIDLPGGIPGRLVRWFRDALRAGIPSGVFNPESGHVDVGAFKTYLKDSMNKLPIESDSLKSITDLIDRFDEPTCRMILEAVKKATDYAGERTSFTVELTEKTFVLYSVGADGQRALAADVGEGGKDILIFPPLLSLERQRGPSAGGADPK